MSSRDPSMALDDLFRQALVPTANVKPAAWAWARILDRIESTPESRRPFTAGALRTWALQPKGRGWCAALRQSLSRWIGGYDIPHLLSVRGSSSVEPCGGCWPAALAELILHRGLDQRFVASFA